MISPCRLCGHNTLKRDALPLVRGITPRQLAYKMQKYRIIKAFRIEGYANIL